VLLQESKLTRAQADELWAQMNDAAKSANLAIHTEAQGAVIGTDHAVKATNDYIDALYSSRNPAVVRDPADPALLPPSWAPQPNEDAQLSQAKANTWVKLTGKYCMGCHRSNSLDFAQYPNFQALSSTLGNKSVLEHYIIDDQTDPTRKTTLYMPQTELMFERLQKDIEARDFAHDWANQANSPSTPVCEVSIEVDGAWFTQVGQDVWIAGNVAELGNWAPANGAELAGALVNNNWTGVWRGTFVVPQGENIQFKATIVDAQGNTLQWEPSFATNSGNREFHVPNSSTANLTVTWGQP
jgi:hypothetical protein